MLCAQDGPFTLTHMAVLQLPCMEDIQNQALVHVTTCNAAYAAPSVLH